MGDKKYIQFSCIDKIFDNEEYFDELMDKIEDGNPKDVVTEMYETFPESNLEKSYSRDVIASGKANNFEETIVYDNGEFILSASPFSITLYTLI